MAPIPHTNSTGNRFLDAVAVRARESVLSHARIVSLAEKEVVCHQGQPIGSVLFPVTAVLSLVTLLKDGSAVEIAMIGREGVLGAPVALGADTASDSECVCQMAGEAWSVPAADFREELEHDGILRDLCMRYIGVLLVHVGQRVACSRLHHATERCARWLLMVQDGVNADRFRVTHETLSFALGLRRASVTEALERLSQTKAIRTGRGSVQILDRKLLESLSCECYDVMREAVDALLGPAPASRPC